MCESWNLSGAQPVDEAAASNTETQRLFLLRSRQLVTVYSETQWSIVFDLKYSTGWTVGGHFIANFRSHIRRTEQFSVIGGQLTAQKLLNQISVKKKGVTILYSRNIKNTESFSFFPRKSQLKFTFIFDL